ncbi:aminoglycoside phosphotransferase [Mycoavidus cysteinexigens]|uniref:Aminoglycoside phosphotransferase n=1 Tax=Mycoavidus cysteinexigens TaxID=1553431 RepID=A0A2Z6EXK3_9BURK|nr:phosphotransferase [Mycoavidus cysteinexigens]BBE10098.1 aminoglycoside phosphotransferase [Mycoavidus cysteinexigens]GAM53557.1 Predicted phosphotransferase related to Ser/Thr protein kinases [bacterium endosymbiont of Mortierella elongata FMR23-6]GLR00514.1 aminoglycoside phosphotransferase [Mycoavidus cysteinexigens]
MTHPSLVDTRLTLLSDWLATLPKHYQLDLTSLESASADAGARRYFRLASAGSYGPTLLAVDAPPPQKCVEFATIALILAQTGIHAPQVYESDFTHGFMLITDLGRATYLKVILSASDPLEAYPLFDAALNALIRWQCATRAEVLPIYDEAFVRRELELFPTWYLERHLGITVDQTLRTTLDSIFTILVENALTQPKVFMHRDYMPRNLMASPPNPGVIDFQDAVLGPITYDVVSLFRDAFISWDESFELDCIAQYWERAKKAGLPVRTDFAQFYRELEWMGLQRHLKILGLFARLYYLDGKANYLADTPRFIIYVRNVAQRYRELAPLLQILDKIEGAKVNR